VALTGVAHCKVPNDGAGLAVTQVGFHDAEGMKHVHASLVGDADDSVVPEMAGIVEMAYLDGELIPKLVRSLLKKLYPWHAQYLHQMRDKRQPQPLPLL
jgi:hypothetical protein